MNVVLHIGQPKTGTSSIQRFLHHNKKALETLGYCYHTYDEQIETTQQGSILSKKGFDFYNHSDQLLKLFTQPQQVKESIEKLVQRAIDRKLHTLIISSELLFDGVFQQKHIEALVQMINRPITAVVFLKRPDLYIESMWQQWYFKDFDNFSSYLEQKNFPVYYPQIAFWKKMVAKLSIVPFEKKYFVEGLEKCFLKNIGITCHERFDFDYVSDTDIWGQNEGLTSEALSLIMLNKDIITKYNDEFILHKFLKYNLSSLFKKQHGETYNFLTYEQRINILKKHELSLKKIALEFFNSPGDLFTSPKPYSGTSTNQVTNTTIIRALMQIGVKQERDIQQLTSRIERLEKTLQR